ncbi:MAG: L,D-transpeptidase, partial [Patescibacteria group bacterium]|nr:L,D-transpeptidase [Patescibacteria group bacterium]
MLQFSKGPKNIWWYSKRIGSAVVIGLLVFFVASFFLQKSQTFCANSISCIKNLTVHVENNAVGIFEGQKVTPPKINLAQPVSVVTPQTTGEKHIYVDLSSQTLYAYQGDTLVLKTLISSG